MVLSHAAVNSAASRVLRMSVELEIKLRLADPAGLRATLAVLGAVARGATLETNHVLDTSQGSVRAAGGVLRVRTLAADPPAALFTYKGPRGPDPSQPREELETAAADGPTLLKILARLGFHETIRYEKRRESWSLAGCEIVIDELPRLGWFVEIEGPDLPHIQAARKQIGLDHEPEIAESYVGMTARLGTESGLRRELTFGTSEPSAR